MLDTLRDSAFGVIINHLSNGRILPYPEQRPDFVVPPYFLPQSAAAASSPKKPEAVALSPASTVVATPVNRSREDVNNIDNPSINTAGFPRIDTEATLRPTASRTLSRTGSLKHKRHGGAEVVDVEGGRNPLAELDIPDERFGAVKGEPNLVDWYGPDDPANPQNWSTAKKVLVMGDLMLLTFAVYAASAMYTASIPYIMETYNASRVVATLGLSLFIAGYGVGPVFLSPLQEIPVLGRNTVYIAAFALYFFMTLATPLVNNVPGIIILRALAGFFGSPALASGAATIGDVVSIRYLPYLIGLWAMGAVLGPVSAPAIGSFAAMANGWRWPEWILVWLSGFTFLVLFFTFPETSAQNILLRRARRLRKLTGNPNLKSFSEKEQESMDMVKTMSIALARPIRLAFEPAVAFLSIYLGFVYALFYLWFESFPWFGIIYGFNEGEIGLAFLGFGVTGVLTYIAYALYCRYHLEPRWVKNNGLEPEVRLELALIANAFIPIALLWFGWTMRKSVFWIVPIIAASFYLPGIYLNFQAILMYLALSYGENAASVMATNTLIRSVIAASFPLFGQPLFKNLGLGPGSTMLAGISILMYIPLYLLYRYGKQLRAFSKFAPLEITKEVEEGNKEATIVDADAVSRV